MQTAAQSGFSPRMKMRLHLSAQVAAQSGFSRKRTYLHFFTQAAARSAIGKDRIKKERSIYNWVN